MKQVEATQNIDSNSFSFLVTPKTICTGRTAYYVNCTPQYFGHIQNIF